jgi:hypothetical protein
MIAALPGSGSVLELAGYGSRLFTYDAFELVLSNK